MDRLAYSFRAAAAILDAMGLNEDEIIKYLNEAEKPTEGYVYINRQVKRTQ